jgi:Uma2 family endonuclease
MQTLTKSSHAAKASKFQFMTEEEFLEFCDEDIRAEFIDGRVILHSPASLKHVSLSSFVVTVVQLFVDNHNFGRVIGDNFQVRLRPGLRRVPDLIFVSNDNPVKITETEIDGAPALVVEIVSPDSVGRDWRDKFFEYEKAKIKEYWIIDPNNKRCEIYCLNEKGKYQIQTIEKGIIKSKVLSGFWLKVEWLWQEPLPNVLTVAKQLKIKI